VLSAASWCASPDEDSLTVKHPDNQWSDSQILEFKKVAPDALQGFRCLSVSCSDAASACTVIASLHSLVSLCCSAVLDPASVALICAGCPALKYVSVALSHLASERKQSLEYLATLPSLTRLHCTAIMSDLGVLHELPQKFTCLESLEATVYDLPLFAGARDLCNTKIFRKRQDFSVVFLTLSGSTRKWDVKLCSGIRFTFNTLMVSVQRAQRRISFCHFGKEILSWFLFLECLMARDVTWESWPRKELLRRHK
jgi:hypothetical protein